MNSKLEDLNTIIFVLGVVYNRMVKELHTNNISEITEKLYQHSLDFTKIHHLEHTIWNLMEEGGEK